MNKISAVLVLALFAATSTAAPLKESSFLVQDSYGSDNLYSTLYEREQDRRNKSHHIDEINKRDFEYFYDDDEGNTTFP